MADDKLLIERYGSVALLCLNDPASRYPLTPGLVAAFCEFLAGANADKSLHCIVLTGMGKGFCTGGNIKDMRDGTDPMYAGSPNDMQ